MIEKKYISPIKIDKKGILDEIVNFQLKPENVLHVKKLF